MQLLCPITDWQTTEAARGKAKGNQITSRLVVAADNWNWVIGTQRNGESGNVVGDYFVGNLSMLFGFFERRDDFDAADANGKVISALEKRSGTKAPPRKSGEAWEQYGRRLDDVFGTSYLREFPPKVLKKVFNSDAESE